MSKTKVCRDLNKLHPYCKQQALLVVKEAKAEGLNVDIFETVRTLERQKWLKANGKSKTLNSYHRLGLAVDFVFKTKKGNWTWRVADAKWKKLAEIIEKHGFYSLGKRKGWDYPHGQINLRGLPATKLIKELSKRDNDLKAFWASVVTPALQEKGLWSGKQELSAELVRVVEENKTKKVAKVKPKTTEKKNNPWWVQIFEFFGGK